MFVSGATGMRTPGSVATTIKKVQIAVPEDPSPIEAVSDENSSLIGDIQFVSIAGDRPAPAPAPVGIVDRIHQASPCALCALPRSLSYVCSGNMSSIFITNVNKII